MGLGASRSFSTVLSLWRKGGGSASVWSTRALTWCALWKLCYAVTFNFSWGVTRSVDLWTIALWVKGFRSSGRRYLWYVYTIVISVEVEADSYSIFSKSVGMAKSFGIEVQGKAIQVPNPLASKRLHFEFANRLVLEFRWKTTTVIHNRRPRNLTTCKGTQFTKNARLHRKHIFGVFVCSESSQNAERMQPERLDAVGCNCGCWSGGF